jgi:uracil-DNA glycosylase
VIVCLGQFAWQAIWRELGRAGLAVPKPRPAFGHGAEVELAGLLVVGCYHPSQQNTFTGKVTGPMLDAIFSRAKAYAGLG